MEVPELCPTQQSMHSTPKVLKKCEGIQNIEVLGSCQWLNNDGNNWVVPGPVPLDVSRIHSICSAQEINS